MSTAFASLIEAIRERGDAIALRVNANAVTARDLIGSIEDHDPLLVDGAG